MGHISNDKMVVVSLGVFFRRTKMATYQVTVVAQVESSLPLEQVEESIGTYSDNPDITILDSDVDKVEVD